jgi:hypothetical protein
MTEQFGCKLFWWMMILLRLIMLCNLWIGLRLIIRLVIELLLYRFHFL